MKNYYIFLISISFVALVIAFSAYRFANPSDNNIAGQNLSKDLNSQLQTGPSSADSLDQTQDTSSNGVSSPVSAKGATPTKRAYNGESEDDDD